MSSQELLNTLSRGNPFFSLNSPHDVRVLSVSLHDAHLSFDLCVSCLSAQELRRANHFRFAKDRSTYAAAHMVLRTCLAHALHTEPEAIQFTNSEHGKPFLDSSHSSGVDFSLSHTDGLAAVAISASFPVGIDVETLRAVDDQFEIAQRFFPAADCARLCGLPDNQRSTYFLQCWTRLEAHAKATGLGLAGCATGATLAPMSYVALDVPPNFVGMLAVQGKCPNVTHAHFSSVAEFLSRLCTSEVPAYV